MTSEEFMTGGDWRGAIWSRLGYPISSEMQAGPGDPQKNYVEIHLEKLIPGQCFIEKSQPGKAAGAERSLDRQIDKIDS